MKTRHERYQEEHLDNLQFEEVQARESLESLEAQKTERAEQEDILLGYLGQKAFNDIANMEDYFLDNITS